MKTLFLSLAMSCCSFATFGQNDVYLSTMISTIEKMEHASDKEDYLKCASQFERIASAEKTKWLPYYYSAYSLILMSFDETDGSEKDQVLDKAQEMLDQAFTLEPNESELHVLQAFLYPSRILVDPMGRGMLYMEKMFRSIETAKLLNPDNPRIYFLEGINKLNLPPSMGGGAEVAKPILLNASVKYKAFQNEDPLWPDWGAGANQAELQKLQ